MNAAARRKYDINECEKEEPNNINEMPVPCSRFEAEMLLWFKTTLHEARPTYKKEDCSD